MGKHSPDVIVYDVALPYEENWKFLRLLQSSEPLRDIRWVITTTHKKHLQELVKDCGEVYEVVGKPYDLEQIIGTCEENGVAGIVATNTTLDHSAIPSAQDEAGGLSGVPLREKSDVSNS